jgi:beta-glucosidase
VHDLAPGALQTISIALDKYAVSYWRELYDTWTVENGVYVIKVGTTSDRLNLQASFSVETGFEWSGL